MINKYMLVSQLSVYLLYSIYMYLLLGSSSIPQITLLTVFLVLAFSRKLSKYISVCSILLLPIHILTIYAHNTVDIISTMLIMLYIILTYLNRLYLESIDGFLLNIRRVLSSIFILVVMSVAFSGISLVFQLNIPMYSILLFCVSMLVLFMIIIYIVDVLLKT